ncbi:MAG: hypothetical protein C4519_17380 [Desulfobacteraceae bacterium]|nr:MAG: hypothetical protein C4519_17380 [Desulfobacteraceae bacterium]
MRNRIAAAATVSLLIGFWFLGGCAKPKMAIVSTAQWTQLESGAYVVGGERLFYGIGKASGLRNATLLRATADNQARAEMARVIESYLKLLSAAAGDLPEADRTEIINALTESILQRTRISDHHYTDTESHLLSLCSLELSSLKQVIQNMGGMDDTLRKNMLTHADQVHADFP